MLVGVKTRNIIYIILLGAICLYCARGFIQASINATSDSFDAYYSILGWAIYLIGWVIFIGGIVATVVNLVITSTKDLKE